MYLGVKVTPKNYTSNSHRVRKNNLPFFIARVNLSVVVIVVFDNVGKGEAFSVLSPVRPPGPRSR